MPLIFILILTIIIPTIIYVGKNIIQPTETAEIEKQEDTNEEKISAEKVTVNAGYSYRVPKDGIYKIELHGGKSADIKRSDGTIILGNKGSKVTGYVRLVKGDILSTEGATRTYFRGILLNSTYIKIESGGNDFSSGSGLALELNGHEVGAVSRSSRGKFGAYGR